MTWHLGKSFARDILPIRKISTKRYGNGQVYNGLVGQGFNGFSFSFLSFPPLGWLLPMRGVPVLQFYI